jgi:FG-GAP repeat/Secretion system C-terminal sorting domain
MRPGKFYPFLAIAFSIILCNHTIAQTANDAVDPQWYSKAVENIKQTEEGFYPAQQYGMFRVANAANHIGFQINAGGYSVQNIKQQDSEPVWNVEFRLKGINRSAAWWKTGTEFSAINRPRQLTYHHLLMDIEYKNDASGLRQNFIVKQKMQGTGSLNLAIEVNSALTATLYPGNKLGFHTPGNEKDIKLFYEDLHVWDANHEPLDAHMKLDGTVLTIIVDDSKAVYPVTIDPLNKTAEWATSVNGVISSLLTNTQLQAALYGFTVTNLGDVNGDSYGDAAISAPALVDVFSGSGSLASVGAVFVFYGTSNGLSATPAKTLQPNTCVAGALFGFSVDAGDVTGDGLNDIIVGAPLDRIDLVFGIIPAHGTVGKVYVYPGGSLANPNPSNFLTIQLNTSYIGLLNISVNALFGFSVAVTEDMNGDNKKDILVGSPTFAALTGLLAKTGGAFLYLSGANNTFPVVQSLDAPSFSLLGINIPLLNAINGLLFGYSVDGTGDYNNDGKPDIVVGAPAGVDLSSLTGILSGQVLGGQAMVYYGKSNNTGVTTSIGARLQAGSNGLLGNAANLFGYKVKGIRNTNGTRNGNIVIGAPVGGLIPNALSLTIQTGNISVFKKKGSSPASPVIPDQQLESPRSTSLLQVLSTLDVNVLFGTSIDNAYDVNCDGFPDLVVGEPLSSGATLLQLQANAVGGAAYVFIGDGTGGYVPTPKFEASTTYGPDFLSVNATSLFGFSVAGVPGIRGLASTPRILVGSPSGALDFNNSILNLGSTLGLLLDFTVGDNGLGKSFLFDTKLCSGGTLPVTLTTFEGKEKNNAINLHWQTNDEVNVNHYEVERSVDGINFSTLGLVFSWDNSRNNDYYFPDRNIVRGTSYYRLKIVDKDQTFTYSKTITFRHDAAITSMVSVYPNPAKEGIRVMIAGYEKGVYSIEIRNMAGQLRVSRSMKVNDGQHVEYIERTPDIIPGVYLLSVYDKNNKRISINKVIVQ